MSKEIDTITKCIDCEAIIHESDLKNDKNKDSYCPNCGSYHLLNLAEGWIYKGN